ncbi:MAG: hypothetical protein MR008_04515 [Aerococcus sp.]|nr:hypothetical protein [Aerococcus sp.]
MNRKQINQNIRERIFQNELQHWQIADEVGIADSTFSRWLRKELDDEKKHELTTLSTA